MKNRYMDILPLNHSRVKLHSKACDYINANHISPIVVGGPSFIASQGPLPSTMQDHWKMIAQQNVRIIVMVTNCKELGKTKCQKYWPNVNNQFNFDSDQGGPPISVVTLSETYHASKAWVEREIRIDSHKTKTSRKVVQFHFMIWPDRGVPDSPKQS